MYLALRVLGFFSNGQPERGVTELARDFAVSKATIYRVIQRGRGENLLPLAQHCLAACLWYWLREPVADLEH